MREAQSQHGSRTQRASRQSYVGYGEAAAHDVVALVAGEHALQYPVQALGLVVVPAQPGPISCRVAEHSC